MMNALTTREGQPSTSAKFTPLFDAALKRHQVEGSRTTFRSPNLNAFVERFIQSVQKECLDHFAILGTKHLDHLCKEYLAHYHEGRCRTAPSRSSSAAAPGLCNRSSVGAGRGEVLVEFGGAVGESACAEMMRGLPGGETLGQVATMCERH